MEVQARLGADLVMAFDECAPASASREEAAAAAERTARWARRSLEAHRRPDQWLFGIVQGGTHLDLRERSVADVTALGFPGHAIGGLAVGEAKQDTWRVVDHVAPMLPEGQPRYLMGVGTPEDLLYGVARGVDLFDCVLPTRNARYRADPRPPDPACGCFTCRTASRAYLRHLHLANEMTAAILMTLHNLAFYLDTLRALRQNTLLGRFEEFRAEVLRSLAASEAEEEGGPSVPRP